MSKNKYDFIIELLGNKKLSDSQREKIFHLTREEIKLESINHSKLEQRVTMIEQRLKLPLINKDNIKTIPVNINQKKITDNKISLHGKNTNKLDNYIDPKSLYDFLLEFNQDPILKTTCHEIDDQDTISTINIICQTDIYDFEKHYKQIKISFENLTTRYQINRRIFTMFKSYIDSKTPKWSSDNVAMSWAHEDLRKWCKENPERVPNPGSNLINLKEKNGYILKNAFTSTLTNKNITTFSELVLFFKSLFHIKNGNSLKELIILKNKKESFDTWANIEICKDNFWSDLQLLTDVDKLVQAYSKITYLIKSVVQENGLEKPNIKVSFYEENDIPILSIHHTNTYYKMSVGNVIDRPFGNSFTPIIQNQINGLCDLYLKANFSNNQYAYINLWNGMKRTKTQIPEFEGVEYILKFKK